MTLAAVVRAGASLEGLAGQRLRVLSAAAQALRGHLARWPGPLLGPALAAHQEAVCLLHFERLVGAGLRAGPSERDEAAFRREVAAVSECTQVTWDAVRNALQAVASAPVESDAVVLDYVIEFRALQRKEAEVSAKLASLSGDLGRQAEAAAATGGADATALLERSTAAMRRLRQIQQVRAAGAGVQAAAYLLLDGRASLAYQLRKLVDTLRGGLLERLRLLVLHNVSTPAGELAAAQMARGELETSLAEVRAHLARVEAGQQDLLDQIDALDAALVAAGTPQAAAIPD